MISISELRPTVERFYRAFKIPISIYEKNNCVVSYVPTALPLDPAYQHLNERTRDQSRHVSYISHYGIHFGFIQMVKTDFCLLLGPASAISCTSQHLDNILGYLNLPFSKKAALNHWFTHTPLMELSQFQSVIRFLDHLVNESNDELDDADADSITTPPSYPNVKSPNIMHNSQYLEDLITGAIETGNPNTLMETFNMITKDNRISFGQIGKTSFQVLCNVVLTVNVIVSRAAIRAGLDYEYALTLSDYYAQTAYSIQNENEFFPLIGTIMMDFCNRVRQLKQPQDISPLTRSIISNVLANLYNKPTVAGIAEQLGYSQSCISHTFKSDMKVPLKTWIQEQKIKEADRLLNAEKRSITDVSTMLGYSSPSHFQSAYKKIKGCTPGKR